MRNLFVLVALSTFCLTVSRLALADGHGMSFGDCASEVATEMLPGDCSPLHVLPNGKIISKFSPDNMAEPRDPIANLKNKDARHETWEVVVPPMAVCPETVKGSRTELTIERDKNGSITSITSKKFPPPRPGSKALWGTPVTITANYSYGAGSCQIDQITKKGMVHPDATATTFDRQLCKTVMGIAGKKNPKNLSESQRANILKAMDERNEDLTHNQDVAAPLSFDQNQSGIEDMIPVCSFNGVNAPAAQQASKLHYDLHDLTTTGGSKQ